MLCYPTYIKKTFKNVPQRIYMLPNAYVPQRISMLPNTYSMFPNTYANSSGGEMGTICVGEHHMRWGTFDMRCECPVGNMHYGYWGYALGVCVGQHTICCGDMRWATFLLCIYFLYTLGSYMRWVHVRARSPTYIRDVPQRIYPVGDMHWVTHYIRWGTTPTC